MPNAKKKVTLQKFLKKNDCFATIISVSSSNSQKNLTKILCKELFYFSSLLQLQQ